MALQTDTTIKIGETIIRNFSRLAIIQKIHDHHSFTLEVRKDLLVDEFKSVMPVSQQLSGAKISIEIIPAKGLDDLMIIQNPKDYVMQFYGVITKVNFQKSNIRDVEETILIQGHSTSKLLDNAQDCCSFTKMTLEEIVNKVKSGYEIDMHVHPYYKDKLAYTVQYNESDFNFLNRLAMRHGQWFYDNGRMIVFGTPGSSSVEPTLVHGVNLHDFSYDIELMPVLLKILENDNRKGDYSSDDVLKYRKEIDGFHQNFINKSNEVFNKETVMQRNQNPVEGYGDSTGEEYAKNKMREIAGKMMQIRAISEVPGITIGNNVIVRGVDIQLDSSYTVTEITHSCDDGGGYENHFTAVNFNGNVFSPKTNPDLIPICKSQTAIVTANADPDGLSGVQIQMPWQELKGETTPYIPVLQKYGGDARGAHVIPEIGDTVYVSFQGDNAELPIVEGTLASAKEKSGYSTPNNDLKVFRTRSGILIVCNDEEGSVLIEDPSGNKYFMDGKGSMELDAPKNMTFNAGENININAGQNMNTNIGFNKTDTVGGDYTETITGSKSLNIGIDFILNVTGKMFEWIKGSKETKSEEIKEMAQELFISSTEKSINLKGSKDINSHSGENSRNY
ncbi:type IV secretion protein Rhs [Flavobacterium sp. ANB]|uniref:contractile injection system protein, VgrG/Pvc8 family n=1 Tax=unclassified Flavobacterium TaxID=196869 RepID=UPI0012B882E4|nr:MULTISPECIES: contractile injection system protein, VgrG/Pvc8 family [unclassified Flavobacterium]MBF4515639.1 type IV secretion protein Rhs [Flavobacterium sp. ANB]MTD68642.1 type IV secretion protein Rhs [Flavobacterium sp. LC2016-13]